MYSTYLMFKNQIQSRARLVNNTLTVLYSCRFKQIQKLQLLALFALWKFSNSRAYILDLESKLVHAHLSFVEGFILNFNSPIFESLVWIEILTYLSRIGIKPGPS